MFLVIAGISITISGLLLFTASKNSFDDKLFMAFFLLFFSNALIFYFEYIGKGDYKKVSPKEFMFIPYARFLIIFIILIIGDGLYETFLSYDLILLLMIIAMATVKIIFEIKNARNTRNQKTKSAFFYFSFNYYISGNRY